MGLWLGRRWSEGSGFGCFGRWVVVVDGWAVVKGIVGVPTGWGFGFDGFPDDVDGSG